MKPALREEIERSSRCYDIIAFALKRVIPEEGTMKNISEVFKALDATKIMSKKVNKIKKEFLADITTTEPIDEHSDIMWERPIIVCFLCKFLNNYDVDNYMPESDPMIPSINACIRIYNKTKNKKATMEAMNAIRGLLQVYTSLSALTFKRGNCNGIIGDELEHMMSYTLKKREELLDEMVKIVKKMYS